mmetsp:Transcript_1570/g.2955  ORF Transcript_1570/g.2955 Transcript_1570/m.2955 type:complete len:220 (+) Transcript_1570:379-1038(+)|eukprot:6172175-Pleurochrysis_carterae.AAC.2
MESYQLAEKTVAAARSSNSAAFEVRSRQACFAQTGHRSGKQKAHSSCCESVRSGAPSASLNRSICSQCPPSTQETGAAASSPAAQSMGSSGVQPLGTCPICLHDLASSGSRPHALGCTHVFCDECLVRHVRLSFRAGRKPGCPLCRRPIPATEFPANTLVRTEPVAFHSFQPLSKLGKALAKGPAPAAHNVQLWQQRIGRLAYESAAARHEREQAKASK